MSRLHQSRDRLGLSKSQIRSLHLLNHQGDTHLRAQLLQPALPFNSTKRSLNFHVVRTEWFWPEESCTGACVHKVGDSTRYCLIFRSNSKNHYPKKIRTFLIRMHCESLCTTSSCETKRKLSTSPNKGGNQGLVGEVPALSTHSNTTWSWKKWSECIVLFVRRAAVV